MSHIEQPNFVHLDENWKQTLSNESRTAKRFESEWGFMTYKGTPTHTTRPHATTLVKYFNPRGGTWTVQPKRVPLTNADDVPELSFGVAAYGRSKLRDITPMF